MSVLIIFSKKTADGGDRRRHGHAAVASPSRATTFSHSYVGEGKVRRGTKDLDAAGITLESTRDISISGYVFSGLRPKALVVKGQPSRRVVFAGNVLSDASGE